MNRPPKPRGPKFSLIGYRIDSMPFSRYLDILMETGMTQEEVKHMTKLAHGFEPPEDQSVSVFYVVSEEEMDMWKAHGVSPTILQLIGASEVVSLSRDDCNAKFIAMKEGDE